MVAGSDEADGNAFAGGDLTVGAEDRGGHESGKKETSAGGSAGLTEEASPGGKRGLIHSRFITPQRREDVKRYSGSEGGWGYSMGRKMPYQMNEGAQGISNCGLIAKPPRGVVSEFFQQAGIGWWKFVL